MDDNIKIIFNELELEGMKLIQLAQSTVQWWTLLNMVIYFQVPLKAKNFLSSRATVGSPRTQLHTELYTYAIHAM
jgi:hypothetical protein